MRPVWISLLVIALCGCQPDRIDEYVQSVMANQRIPGMAIAIIKQGEPADVRTYGLANVEHSVPVTEKTAFRLASISKQITATAIMMLSEAGKLDVRDSFCDFLDQCPESWKDIEIRHLLTHTSGMPRRSPVMDPMDLQTTLEVIEGMYDVELESQPGDAFLYSNIAYSILGEVITNVSGQLWSDYVREHIFLPLGMNDTRTADYYELIPHRAEGYRFSDNVLYRDDIIIAVRPSGGYVSTIADMVKWDHAISNLTLISESSREIMWAPAILNDGTNTNYGFGWWNDEVGGVRRVRHGGSNPGFRTWYTQYIDYDLRIIVLANSWGTRPHSIARDIGGFFIDELRIDRRPIELTVEDRERFVGRYESPDGHILTVGIDADGLSTQWGEWQPQEKMIPETPNSFYFVTKDESYVFHSENGVVTKLVIEYGENQSIDVRRISE
jgi:CubicO group peptidase (beta-lactamase class C family)